MAWTGPYPTWTVGQVSLASDWNTYVAGNVSFLAAAPAGRMYPTNQTVIEAATSQVTSMVQDYAQNGVTYASNALTVTVAGIYTVSWQTLWGASTNPPDSGYWYSALVYVNGTAVRSNTINYSSGATDSAPPTPGGCDNINIPAGAVLTLWGATLSNSAAVNAPGTSGPNGTKTWLSCVLTAGTTTTG